MDEDALVIALLLPLLLFLVVAGVTVREIPRARKRAVFIACLAPAGMAISFLELALFFVELEGVVIPLLVLVLIVLPLLLGMKR